MKFDFAIGNPPYQDETLGDNKGFAPPVYHLFLESAYEIADTVEMIHPARFLFDAGSTPKQWNEKMLSDTHFKVLKYEANSAAVFSNTDIKGGVAITYRDVHRRFGEIGNFIVFNELREIVKKVGAKQEASISSIVFAPESYKFTDKMHSDYPNVEGILSKGHKYDFKTNVLEKLNGIVFFDVRPDDGLDYVQILGLVQGKRTQKWIARKYIKTAENFSGYKVFVPKANGSGALGEVLSTPLIGQPLIGQPLIGHTQTYISIGNYKTLQEAENLMTYIRTKFCRAMLGVLKITQDNPGPKWKYVPLQDFTDKSDIDWSVSVSAIDQQLYKKYGLTGEEISFIETHVKEMA